MRDSVCQPRRLANSQSRFVLRRKLLNAHLLRRQIEFAPPRVGKLAARLGNLTIRNVGDDSARLITVSNGKEGGIHVWDLRAIRRQLKALDLDWDAPEYPPEPPPAQTPLRLEVVLDPGGP